MEEDDASMNSLNSVGSAPERMFFSITDRPIHPIFSSYNRGLRYEEGNQEEFIAAKSLFENEQNVKVQTVCAKKIHEDLLWSWEGRFFLYAARKFLQQFLEGLIEGRIQIPSPRWCIQNKKEKVAALLVCDVSLEYDARFCSINGVRVNGGNFREKMEDAKKYCEFVWEDNIFACIIHFFSEDSELEQNMKRELVLPGKEVFDSLKGSFKGASFAYEIVHDCIPMFPFSDVNTYPPFYGQEINGFKVGIFHELIMMNPIQDTNFREIEHFSGTMRNFDVFDHKGESGAILECFLRALKYTLEKLETGLNHPNLVEGINKESIQSAVDACKLYKLHFDNCFLTKR